MEQGAVELMKEGSESDHWGRSERFCLWWKTGSHSVHGSNSTEGPEAKWEVSSPEPISPKSVVAGVSSTKSAKNTVTRNRPKKD